MLTSGPGANVTLTCPGGAPGDNATVHWVLGTQGTGSGHDRWAALGGTLLLRSVQLRDSGNYSCYRDGLPAGTLRLLVEGELCPQSSGGAGEGETGRWLPASSSASQVPCLTRPPTAASKTGGHSRWVGATGWWGHCPAGRMVQ